MAPENRASRKAISSSNHWFFLFFFLPRPPFRWIGKKPVASARNAKTIDSRFNCPCRWSWSEDKKKTDPKSSMQKPRAVGLGKNPLKNRTPQDRLQDCFFGISQLNVVLPEWVVEKCLLRFNFCSPTAECYGVFAQYRFRCVLGELGLFREGTGFREPVPGSGSRSGSGVLKVVPGFDGSRQDPGSGVPKVVPGFEGFGVPGFDGFWWVLKV